MTRHSSAEPTPTSRVIFWFSRIWFFIAVPLVAGYLVLDAPNKEFPVTLWVSSGGTALMVGCTVWATYQVGKVSGVVAAQQDRQGLKTAEAEARMAPGAAGHTTQSLDSHNRGEESA